jgi:hypothetical protein
MTGNGIVELLDPVAAQDAATKHYVDLHPGTVGPAGPTGPAGSVWRNGTGAPSNSLGVNGDYYLNDTNGDVYLKTAGTYSIVANIKGAPGTPGATGPTGPAGATGSTGATGPQGIAGTPGEKWWTGVVSPSTGTGIDGDWYLNNATGDIWEKVSGAWVSRGNLRGPAGPTGSTGAPGSATDGLAPSASPATVQVVPGLGTLHVFWSAITNADPVVYDVHMSITSGFTPSSATLNQSIQGTAATIRSTSVANVPLDPATTYYIKIVARDKDGSAAPSAEVSGMPAYVTGPDIAADTITGDNIIGNTITADLLASTLVMSSQIVVPSLTGQRVVIDPSGVRLIASDGTVIVNLPTDPSQQPTFNGNVVTGGLTATGNMRIQGATNLLEGGAQLTLQYGQTPPAQAPGVYFEYETRGSGLSTSDSRGIDYDPNGKLAGGGTGPTFLFVYSNGTNWCLGEYDPAASAVVRTFATNLTPANQTPSGIARVGAYILMGYQRTSDLAYRIGAWNQSDMSPVTPVGAWTLSVVASNKIAIGTDGTYLLTCEWDSTSAGASKRITRYTFTGAGGPVVFDQFTLTGGLTLSGNAVLGGITGRNGSEYVTLVRRFVPKVGSGGGSYYLATFEKYSQSTRTKLTTTGHTWSPNAIATAGNSIANIAFGGVTWDGTIYRGNSNGIIVNFNGLTWASDGVNVFWFGHTWYNASGPYESRISPLLGIQLDGANSSIGWSGGSGDCPMYGQLRIVLPPPPASAGAGAAGARVYALRQTVTPATTSMQRQTFAATSTTSAGTTYYLRSYNASGGAYVDTNTFPGGTSIIQADPVAPVTDRWRLIGTGEVVLSRMTVAQRPATPYKGELHFNETAGNLETYDGSGYMPLGVATGEQAIYEAIRAAGGVRVPLAWTLDPGQMDSAAIFNYTAQRLTLALIVVPRTSVCQGGWIYIDGVGTSITAYVGMGLWLVNADGSVTLLRNTTSQGQFINTGGFRFSTWNSARGPYTGNVTLLPGLLYAVGFIGNWTGTAPGVRGRPGMIGNAVISTDPRYRCFGVNSAGTVETTVFQDYPQAGLAGFTNIPCMGVY